MAHIIHAAPRITYDYDDGWSDEDQWGDPIAFKVLAGRMTEEPTSYDDGGTYLARVVGHKRMDKDLQAHALRSHFSGSSCRHEHDCCGCPSTHASVRHVGRGEFSVRIRISYNY